MSTLPILALGAAAWLALSKNSERRRSGARVAVAALGLGLARWQWARWFVEQSNYTVEFRIGSFEVRRYTPSARAETIVEGLPWKAALNEGFRRIAAYTVGRSQHEANERIAMTAPVTATVGPREIATRTVTFTMPRSRLLSSLPTPKDNRVRLRYVPARRVAALRFHGRYGNDLPAKKRDELLARVRLAGFHALGEVTFAGYDPPSTLPWLRRNEVLVDLAR
ncbi:MAG TPA: heme-binding protein [Polyangiaceae bacterium]|nr:heme-binding protein [Polyangiaceae bacterium]